MFSWGGGIALTPFVVDTNKEREPPPSPTPLEFPDYSPPDYSNQRCTESSFNDLYRLLSKLKKPQDVSEEFLRALNLKVETEVPLSEIVPGGKPSYLAPYQWPESPEAQNTSGNAGPSGANLLPNGYPVPTKEKYDLLKREIIFENEDAFRALSREEPPPGRPKVRVTHSRKLWTGLESLSHYWDSSLDRYIEKTVDEPSPKEDNPDGMDVDDAHDSSTGHKMDIDETSSSKEGDEQKRSLPKTKQMYMGRRIGTGRDMPENIREDTLRGFIEMFAWSFGCQIRIPNLPPRLSVESLLFPVRHNFNICRCPRDRQEAKRGVLEGPLLIVQCRGETSFRDANSNDTDQNGRYAEICDLLRETLGMLLLAQERARENTTETKPGETEWWATEPRWGGAPNEGPVGDVETNKENENENEQDPNGNAESDRSFKRSRQSRRGPTQRKLSMAEKWKLVQPGPSLWDKKLRYAHIGKDQDSAFDDIFMVSSLNHHFSVLHLRVHPNYLAWLATGNAHFPDDNSAESEPPWHSLILRRTRWFDFFSPEDRAEGLEGIWALFSWLMR